MLGIVITLVWESIPFFRIVPVQTFLTDTKWTVLFSADQQRAGVLPLVVGTLLVTGVSVLVAVPLGLGGAVYLSEYASARSRRILKPFLELLAGIPTIVYGFFASMAVTPSLRSIFPKIGFFNALSAGIVVGLMILPIIASLSEDAMRNVPPRIREAAYALGATRFEVAWGVILPASVSGVVASFAIALSRAIGETMIVTIAAGATANLTLNPLEAVQTMTAFMAQVSDGDTAKGGLPYHSMYAVGLLLFLFTFFLHSIALRVTRLLQRRHA